MVKNLFAGKIFPAFPLVGQLKHFLNSWEMLTRDQDILSVEEEHKVPFFRKPHQKIIPGNINMILIQENLVDKEILVQND